MEAKARRRRWLRVALVVPVQLAAVYLCWWWSDRDSLSAEERRLAGIWVVSWDDRPGPPGLTVEYEFRADRSWGVVNRDTKTGAVYGGGGGDAEWRLEGGMLTLRSRLERGNRWTNLLSGNTQRTATEIFLVTPDGPDRVRWMFLHSDDPGLTRAGPPHPTGTWSRLGQVERHPGPPDQS